MKKKKKENKESNQYYGSGEADDVHVFDFGANRQQIGVDQLKRAVAHRPFELSVRLPQFGSRS